MMNCSCCKKAKNQLHPVKSDLMDGINLFLCSTCKTEGHEPRHLIILTARSGDGDSARTYIVDDRYCGEKLLAAEITI